MTMNNPVAKQTASVRQLGISAVALTLVSVAGAVQAQSNNGIIFGSFDSGVQLSSDHSPRGIAGTDAAPQVLADFNWAHIAGRVGSTDAEAGLFRDSVVEAGRYVGYAHSIGDTGLRYDVGYRQRAYPDSGDAREYDAFYGVGTYSQGRLSVSPSVWYADEYDDSDATGTAYRLTVGWEFPWQVNASARVGHQTFGPSGDGDLENTYYGVGARKNLGGFDLRMRWRELEASNAVAGGHHAPDVRLFFGVQRSF